MKVGMVYFVLYVVLITELLIVISERDAAFRDLLAQKAALDNLNIEKHELPLKVSIPQDTTNYILPNEWTKDIFSSVILIPENLVSQAETDSVVFYIDIDSSSSKPPFWPEGGMNSKDRNVRRNARGVTKYKIFKNGKYCQFTLMFTNWDIPNNLATLLSNNKIQYKFNVYIETPRIISNDFNSKSQGNILKGLSRESQLKFLRSLPDSNQISKLNNFIKKDSITRKDTTKFFQLARIKQTILKDSLKLRTDQILKEMDRSILDRSQVSSFIIIPREY